MRQITDVAELRSLQMQIMDCIDDFCKKNHLSYSLAGGTLIGAIRHKGYIPWDDDIDIYMPRRDYDKFLKTFDGFNPRYKTYEWHTCPGMHVLFAKVGDCQTLLSEQGSMQDYGVYVDVFPLDGVSPSERVRSLVFKLKTAIYILSHGKSQVFPKGKKWKYKLRWLLARLWPLSRRQSFKLIERLVSRWPESSDVTNLVSMGTSNPQDHFALDLFSPTVSSPFEDREYQIMRGYDEYLTKRFGHYMQLPPESQRIQAHDLIAYMKD